MKKSFKKVGHLVLVLLVVSLVYSCMPRVWYKKSSYGTVLNQLDILPTSKKEELKKFILDTANNAQAVVVMNGEKIILEVGKTKKLINCHSARKSIMSLLIGIAKEKGLLSLDETLEQLGIDESKTPLTKQEKTATIRDLLMAKSGIYLQAEAETDFAKNNRPKRGQHKPGEFFFYNNFDFNVLGAILEKKTGKSIGEFMNEYLAKPLGMQEFSPSNVIYGNPWPIRSDKSDYRVYWMFLSARDFARIGVVVAQKGRWNNQQIVSTEWINESLQPHTDSVDKSMRPFDAYGYLWWIDKDNNTFWADGFGGQFLLIDTARNLVLSQRNFTGNSLLSSGLFMMKKNKDGYRDQLVHIYDNIKLFLDK
jgi:hypothetical protein